MNDEEVIIALNEEIDDLYKMIEEKDNRFERLSKSYVNILGKLNEANKEIDRVKDELHKCHVICGRVINTNTCSTTHTSIKEDYKSPDCSEEYTCCWN